MMRNAIAGSLVASLLLPIIAGAQVAGDGDPDLYYFSIDGTVDTSFGPVTRSAGDLVLDTDGNTWDAVVLTVSGPDVTPVLGGNTGNLCDGCSLPTSADGTSQSSSWVVGYSAGAMQWVRTNPLTGDGFKGVPGQGYLDAGDNPVMGWPADLAPFLDYPELSLATYPAGLDGADFPATIDRQGQQGSFLLVTDLGAEFVGNVTIVEPAACIPSGSSESACSDGEDNDCDGDIDGADSDCAVNVELEIFRVDGAR